MNERWFYFGIFPLTLGLLGKEEMGDEDVSPES